MLLKTLVATGISTAALALATPALAACEDMAAFDLANGEVTSATVVDAGGFALPAGASPPPGIASASFSDLPAFCRVQMTLTPTSDSHIRSEVWLPLDGWNGRYVAVGNGVWAGSLSWTEMGRNVARRYATSATDTGHVGNGMSAEWAVGHPEKLVDFGHRAVHETAVAAKAVVEAFYGRAPDYSFWNSCSTGGRQGLMAAHRYPGDFDAISAMAPANPMTDLMVQSMWAGWQPQRYGVTLGPAQFGMVHAAVVAQCDALDGVTDGVIGRPQQCRFQPASLQCASGQSEGCLSPGQVRAFEGFYDGVRGSDGTWLVNGWPRGSEMQLMVLTMGQEPFPVATSYFRQLVYADQSGWDWRTTPYEDYVADGRSYAADILNVPPTGLGEFFARGGKLLLSHGWNDGLIPPGNTLAFHHALYNALPASQRDSQLRLFMVPGMDHCAGGEGPSEFDTLGTIDSWASTGTAPTQIIASRPARVMSFPGMPPQAPREPMARPLCPWPMVETWDGSGDPMDAASFSCAMPASS